MATRISKLKWDEISGVDHPANETPGWILQKAAGEVADFETAIVQLHKELGSDAAELFFKDADESVRKAVKRVFKHLDESLEEVDEDDDDASDEKVEKRGISKLREILSATVTKSEDGDDDSDDEGDDAESDDDEDDESGADDESGDESSDDDTSDEDDDKDGDEGDDEGDKPVEKSTKLAKSDVDAIVTAFKEELDPIREAVGALADRTDGLEKHAAGRTSLMGQDGSEEDGDEVDEKAGLHKAITGAIRTGEKITLT